MGYGVGMYPDLGICMGFSMGCTREKIFTLNEHAKLFNKGSGHNWYWRKYPIPVVSWVPILKG